MKQKQGSLESKKDRGTGLRANNSCSSGSTCPQEKFAKKIIYSNLYMSFP
jgi:hypothetical protein